MTKIISNLALISSIFGYAAEGNASQHDTTRVESLVGQASIDGEFSYIRKEDRAWEGLSTTSAISRGYEPAPDEDALGLTDQATDEDPPFYGWHLEGDPSGAPYDYGWYDKPQSNINSEARRTKQAAEADFGDDGFSLRRGELKVIRGKITDLRSINLRDENRATARHHLLRLEFQDGTNTIVNLGPGFLDARRRLSVGDRVRIAGTVGKIQNRNVLFARDVAMEKAELSKPDSSANTQRTQRQSTRASKVQLRGFVEDFHRAFLYPGGQAKPLLRVRLENGRAAMVDLGRETAVADLDLEEDASVVVYGTPAISEGRRIIKAEMISVNGDTTVLR
jgi:hypothetical protein